MQVLRILRELDDATAIAAALEGKEVSPLEITRATLEHVHDVNPCLNAIVALDEEAALAAARESERRQVEGLRLSLVDGIPVTVKDNVFVNGFKATWGSRLFQDYEPGIDDLAVARLRSGGAVIIGKTNTPELALDNETTNLVFGTTLNPWDPRLTPGGSSGGAAVSVAARMVPLALGTDSGGSIRQPAGFTGIVGFKPSVGRIARAYGFPALVADFQVIGLMARGIRDITLLASLVAVPDRRDRASLAFSKSDYAIRTLERKKVLVVTEFGGHPVDPQICASIERAAATLSRLGHDVERTALPFDLEPLFDIWRTLSDVGAAHVVQAARQPTTELGDVVRGAADRGASVTAAAYVASLGRLAKFRSDVAEQWSGFDLLLGPSSAVMPWPANPAEQTGDEPASAPYVSMFNKLANATGYPAISVPGEASSSGLPIGVQFVARYGEDELLLSLAREYEAARQ